MRHQPASLQPVAIDPQRTIGDKRSGVASRAQERRMRGELTILGIFVLAIAQLFAGDSPRSRQIAYGLFGLGAVMAMVIAVRGSL